MARIFAAAFALAGIACAAHAQGTGQGRESREIAFEEVLEAPDDLELNLAYARQLIRAGELQQAATTLERLLLLVPDWDEARLVYGIVLYRLEDLLGAIRELELLADRNLAPASERERVRYLRLAQGGEQPLRVFSTYSFGGKVASNPGRAPDNPALRQVIGGDTTRFAFLASAATTIEYDLGGARGDYLFVRSRSFLQDYLDLDQADFVRSSLVAGGRFHGRRISVEPYALYGTAFQSYDRFFSEYGGGVNVAFEMGEGDRVRLFGGVEAAYESYDTTEFSSIGGARDGWRVDGHAGARWRITDASILTLTGRYTDKDAEVAGFAYDRVALEVNHLALLGDGVYLDTRVRWADLDYEGIDPRFTTATPREDEHWRLRAAVGAPLETLFAKVDVELPDALSDIVVQLGTTYTAQDSNVPELDIEDWSGDLLFIKRITW